MTKIIRWLHISDFHVGLDLTAQHAHFNKIIVHIEEMKNAGFLPNKIFITGDVGNSGAENEYTEFQTGFLDKLTNKHHAPDIIIVPGNHDLARRDNSQQYNRLYLSNETKCRHYDPSKPGRTSRLELTSMFESFSKLPGCEWLKEEDGYRHIPGTTECPLEIICFNTSWIAWGNESDFDEEGNLPIGVTAIEHAFEKVSPDRQLIVLGHHPIDWLTKPSREALTRELRKRGGLYLCGHEHQANLDVYQSFSEEAYQLRAGAAFLGRLPSGQDWTNSLIWGELRRSESRNTKLRLRPRYWNNATGWQLWTSNLTGDPAPDGWYELELKRSPPIPQNVKYMATSKVQLDPPSYKAAEVTERTTRPIDLETYLELLESQFEFTYQRTSRNPNNGDYVVFWPVRARQPTLVHAMQAFSAAGLTRYGARVLLVLDDLSGQQNIATTDLEGAINRWFSRVGAERSALSIFKLSQMQSEINQGELWINLITKWFAFQTEYKLGKILAVSKLGDDKNLSDKKARKLLTPTLIWSAFGALMARHNECRFVTLGGADERALWEAWRKCIDDNSVANHIFNPEVKDENQQRIDLDKIGWSSLSEIRDTLHECLVSFSENLSNPPTYWLPFVAYRSCVVLPALIAGNQVEDWDALVSKSGGNVDDLARRLAEKIHAWFLKAH